MQKDHRGLLAPTAHFGSSVEIEKILSRQGFSSPVSQQDFPCRDRVLRPGAQPGLDARDRSSCVRDNTACVHDKAF